MTIQISALCGRLINRMNKISFIIPVYNCGQYLEMCIKNIVDTNLTNYEIILIDDGSSDNTRSICVRMSNIYSEIHYIYQKNQGVSSARNRGLKEAKGEFILFIDADDSFIKDKLVELLKVVESNKKIDLAIYGMTFDYYYHGKCYRSDELSYPITGIMGKKCWNREFVNLYSTNALSPVWNKVFRKDILVKNQICFNEDMFLYEDLEFSLRYLACCNTIYVSSECIYNYRQSEDEGNAGRRLKRIKDLPALIRQIEEVLDDLIVKQQIENAAYIKSILLSLYLVLTREKIAVSGIKGIGQICDDFINWIRAEKIEMPKERNQFLEQLLERKVYTLYLQKIYIALRHKLAVWIKSRLLKKKEFL